VIIRDSDAPHTLGVEAEKRCEYRLIREASPRAEHTKNRFGAEEVFAPGRP
jgi:hypothetical protein